MLVKFAVFRRGFTLFFAAQPDIVENQPGQQDKQHDVKPAHNLIHRAYSFEPDNHLGADFHAHNGTNEHCDAQQVVNIAEFAMTHGGNEGFAGHLRHVRTNGEGHGKAENVQAGRNHPGAAEAEKSADNANAQTKNDQAGPENADAGNRHQDV